MHKEEHRGSKREIIYESHKRELMLYNVRALLLVPSLCSRLFLQ